MQQETLEPCKAVQIPLSITSIGISKMLKIIDSFENLESLTLYITNRSYPNYNNMLVGKAVTKIKELNINFT